MALTEHSPIGALHGIGAVKSKAFAKLGILTIRDLLFHVPRAYEDRGNIRTLSQGTDGEVSSFMLTVGTSPRNAVLRRNMTLTKFRVFDASGAVEVVFFNQPYLQNVFHVGDEFRFTGKLLPDKKTYRLSAPKFEKAGEGVLLPDLVPVYTLTEGISAGQMEKALQEAMEILPFLPDPLPEDIRRKYGFPTLAFALKQLHDPQSQEQIKKAFARLAFEEFFCFSLGMRLSRQKLLLRSAPVIKGDNDQTFSDALPYRLTQAQTRACHEMACDLQKGTPMNRILIGDVGCGKTVCAAYAIYKTVVAGYQAALMAPTEILARQHYADLYPLFSSLGFRTALLLGATSAKEKKQICADLASGEIDLVIGTHALLTETVSFARLGLTVTDEQHRFGVYQRAALREKCDGAHLLVMSATPIPRTLALALYGDLDVSRIDQMPPGRQKVDTFAVDTSYTERLHAFMRKQVEDGGQVYVVCPAIERPKEEDCAALSLQDLLRETERLSAPQKEDTNLSYAVEVAEDMKKIFPDLSVGLLHGRMKSAEKDAVMAAFTAGQTNILVSTTVIEVGVNVPNASLMVIKNAERFGLSQLHQLRGRVGRGTRKAYCVLMSDAKGEIAQKRLAVMRTTYDGYAVAEQDLAARGPGDFLRAGESDTIRQSGGLSFRFAALGGGAETAALAAKEAEELLKNPAAPWEEKYKPLFDEVAAMFESTASTIS